MITVEYCYLQAFQSCTCGVCSGSVCAEGDLACNGSPQSLDTAGMSDAAAFDFDLLSDDRNLIAGAVLRLEQAMHRAGLLEREDCREALAEIRASVLDR